LRLNDELRQALGGVGDRDDWRTRQICPHAAGSVSEKKNIRLDGQCGALSPPNPCFDIM
jgi:hypothetical protein